jgi:hypothetical protein
MRFLRWTIGVPVLGAAGLILTGGYFHLRDWSDLYRYLPSEFPGSAVVRIGFPINAALSALVAVALLVSLFASRRLLPYAVAGAIVFQAGSLAALIQTRTGTLFGWSEVGWAGSAGQTRAVEIAALAVLGVLAVVLVLARGALHGRLTPVTVGRRVAVVAEAP